MDAVLIFAVIVGGALLVRRLRGGKSADIPAMLSVSDRPTATRWEKGVASDLLDQIALEDARAEVIAKLQRATGSAPAVSVGSPVISAEAPVTRQPVA